MTTIEASYKIEYIFIAKNTSPLADTGTEGVDGRRTVILRHSIRHVR